MEVASSNSNFSVGLAPASGATSVDEHPVRTIADLNRHELEKVRQQCTICFQTIKANIENLRLTGVADPVLSNHLESAKAVEKARYDRLNQEILDR